VSDRLRGAVRFRVRLSAYFCSYQSIYPVGVLEISRKQFPTRFPAVSL
jgi:hypothetical protein